MNYDKTVCRLIASRYMLNKGDELKLQIGKYVIEQVQTTKYLGLIIDNELKWDEQITCLCKKTGQMVSFLSRLRHFLDKSSLVLIYKSIILPHFDYADIVWMSASQTLRNQVQTKSK